jgi:hypothetical protein
MRFPNKAILLMGSFLLAKTAVAVPADLKENYQPIIDRNPFGLKPPPPPPTNNVTASVVEKPKTEIFLTGIVSIGYPKLPKQAFLMTKVQNQKEPNYYALTEGVEKDGIKILAIDEVNKKVRINTDSGETMLSFQTHGIAAPAAPAMPLPGQHGAIPGQPGMVPQPMPGGVPQPGNPNFQNQYPQGQPNAAGNTGASTPNSTRSIPSRSIRSRIPNPTDATANPVNPGGIQQNPGQEQQPPMDPAEQYLRMQLDKAAKERAGIPMPPVPTIQ